MELVTGATGFIGRALTGRLLAAGKRVRCLVRPGSNAAGLAGAEILRGDLLDPKSLAEAVKGTDRVWHLGALVRPRGFIVGRRRLLQEFRLVNAEASRLLAEAAAGAGAKRFIYFSSIAALGPGEDISDDTAPRPVTPYGRSKLEGELGLKEVSARTKLDLLILRPSMIYGRGSRPWEELFSSVRRGWLPVPGTAANFFSVCCLENLLDAALLAAEKAAPGAALNISEGALPLRDLLLTAGELLGRKPRLLPLPAALLNAVSRLLDGGLGLAGLAMPGFVGADRTRVQEACASWSHRCEGLRALGWRPTLSTREGLAAALGVKP
jgi:nucleoside-diphosphate-sugar epimerase